MDENLKERFAKVYTSDSQPSVEQFETDYNDNLAKDYRVANMFWCGAGSRWSTRLIVVFERVEATIPKEESSHD